jgi:outer membrane autotransporter protein
VRAYWRHDYGDSAYAIDSNFVGCTDIFTVHGPEMGRDSAMIDAGLTIMCTRHLDAYFYYDGQYGRDNYYVNAVSGGFRLNF